MYLVAQDGVDTPVWFSRYWVKKLRWDFSASEEDSLAFLLNVGRSIEAKHAYRPILLTLADWVAIFIERNADALEERFLLAKPTAPVIRRLANKWEMHLLANEHGIPTPITICPESWADVEEFLETTPFPIVLKPADGYLPHVPSKMIIQSREEMIADFERRESLRPPLNVVLQEYIPGDADSVWMCNGYFGRDTTDPLIFTGKKLRQVSSTGIASLAVCLPNETVAAQTKSFIQAVGYRGCVGIGWRHDVRDGLYKLLDVNARVSGVFRLFAGTNDMDVVRACYLDLTDQARPRTALQVGRKWMLEGDDVPAAISAMRNRKLTVRQWLSSIRGVRELHWFAADDPMPLLILLWQNRRRRFKPLLRRVFAAY